MTGSAPFLGTRVLADVPTAEVLALLDERTLFRARWGYRRGDMTEEDCERMLDAHARPALAILRANALAGVLLDARVVYGWFPCRAAERGIVVCRPDGGEHATLVLSPPHGGAVPRDFVSAGGEAGAGDDVIGIFVATVGDRPLEAARAHYESGSLLESLRVHGFAVEAAEAAAEWIHRRMLRELGVAAEESGPAARRGVRVSPGYPVCPDLSVQKWIFDLLDPSRIGVYLTETFQMVPEASVSAFVFHHPGSRVLTG